MTNITGTVTTISDFTVITTGDGHRMVAETLAFGNLNIAMVSEIQSVSSSNIYPRHTGHIYRINSRFGK